MDILTNRQKETERHAYKQAHGQTDRQPGINHIRQKRKKLKHTHTHTNTHTNTHTHTHKHTHT